MTTPRLRFEANAFEALIAFLALLTSVRFFVAPSDLDASAVAQALPPWDHIWNAGYGLGGLAILLGLWKGRSDIEAAGLAFLASACGIQTMALLTIRGPSAAASIGVFGAVALACGARIFLIVRFGGSRPRDS